jgi:hypothetical protein
MIPSRLLGPGLILLVSPLSGEESDKLPILDEFLNQEP